MARQIRTSDRFGEQEKSWHLLFLIAQAMLRERRAFSPSDLHRLERASDVFAISTFPLRGPRLGALGSATVPEVKLYEERPPRCAERKQGRHAESPFSSLVSRQLEPKTREKSRRKSERNEVFLGVIIDRKVFGEWTREPDNSRNFHGDLLNQLLVLAIEIDLEIWAQRAFFEGN